MTRKIILVAVFLIVCRSWLRSQTIDSINIYYLPLESAFHTQVTFDEVKDIVEPYTLKTDSLIHSLQSILDDSLKRISEGQSFEMYDKDIRMVIRLFSNGKTWKTYVLTTNGNELLIDSLAMKLDKVTVRILLRFIYENCVPVTESQKIYFHALKVERNWLSKKIPHE